MNARRILSFILVTAIAASVAGCTSAPAGGTTTSSAGTPSSTATPSSVAATPTDSNFNETGLPIVKEMVSLKAVSIVADAAKPIEESEMYKELEGKTNVQIKYTTILEKVWPEKKGILFSSNDLPDFFVGDNILSASDVVKYGTQGQLIELQGLMTKYNPMMTAKVDSVPGLRKSMTVGEDKIYSYVGIDNGPMQVSNPAFINKEWLDKVKLPMPTTTEELYTVLKAFKTQDPNGNGKSDEIPFTAMGNNFSDYFGAFGILETYNASNKTRNHIGVKNDGKEVYYTATTDQYKEAIKYFNRLFSEGLIDAEAFSQDGATLNGKLKAEGDRIVGVFQNWRNTAWQRNADETDYVTLPPLKGPNGDQEWPSRFYINNGPFSVGSLAITNVCKSPEIVARWADEFYDPDYSYQISLQQKLGLHIEKQADGTFTPLTVRDDFDMKAANIWLDKTRIHTMTVADYNRAVPKAAHIQQKIDIEQPYLPYIKDNDLYPSVMFTTAETEELSQLATDINGYADECYTRWITNGGIDAEWTAYVEKIKSMGLEKFVKIYQDALDRYNS